MMNDKTRQELAKSRRYDAFGKPDDNAEFVLVDADFMEKMLAVEPTETTTELPENLTLEGNPGDWKANYNMRCWVQEALEAKGAEITGAGFGACLSDLDIELEGMRYNIQIRSRPARFSIDPDDDVFCYECIHGIPCKLHDKPLFERVQQRQSPG